MEKPPFLVVEDGKIHGREQSAHPVGELRAVCLQKPVFQGDKAGAEVVEKQVKKHLAAITEAYRNSNVTAVTEAFKEDIEPQVKKTLKESFINNTVWGVISDRIKNGINY